MQIFFPGTVRPRSRQFRVVFVHGKITLKNLIMDETSDESKMPTQLTPLPPLPPLPPSPPKPSADTQSPSPSIQALDAARAADGDDVKNDYRKKPKVPTLPPLRPIPRRSPRTIANAQSPSPSTTALGAAHAADGDDNDGGGGGDDCTALFSAKQGDADDYADDGEDTDTDDEMKGEANNQPGSGGDDEEGGDGEEEDDETEGKAKRTERDVAAVSPRREDLNPAVLCAISTELYMHFDKEKRKLSHRALTLVAQKFELSYRTLYALWMHAKKNFPEDGDVLFFDMSQNRNNRCGRKRAMVPEEARTKVKRIPVQQRYSLRDLSEKTGMSVHQVVKMTKDEKLKRISSTVKPLLTEANREERVQFASSFIDTTTKSFSSMHYRMHIDEKLFNLKRVKEKYYLLVDEEIPPLRVCKSKRHIPKVMFFCAVARPRHCTRRNCMFDGKLGIWPFVEKVPARRASRNRPAGTIETKAVTVTQDLCRRMLIDNLLPAIREKWPQSFLDETIEIQQDNARPHIRDEDPEWRAAVEASGMNVKLVQQPPNSPDMNVLDLGYFSSIQSLQYKANATTTDELIAAVEDSFSRLKHVSLNNVFFTLQICMEQTILKDGGNDYKIRHINKTKLEREGRLPVSITASDEVLVKIESRLQM